MGSEDNLKTQSGSGGRPAGIGKSKELAVFEEAVAKELRVLIAQKNLRLKTVSAALTDIGIRETEKGLSAKLAAGSFSAAYYMAIKEVINSL